MKEFLINIGKDIDGEVLSIEKTASLLQEKMIKIADQNYCARPIFTSYKKNVKISVHGLV